MPSDTASLRVARMILRRAYFEIRALPQNDPTLRCLLTDLDDTCIDLTTEIEAAEPQLPLRRVA